MSDSCRKPTSKFQNADLSMGNLNKDLIMTDVTIVYWRDMPAQVIVEKAAVGQTPPARTF